MTKREPEDTGPKRTLPVSEESYSVSCASMSAADPQRRAKGRPEQRQRPEVKGGLYGKEPHAKVSLEAVTMVPVSREIGSYPCSPAQNSTHKPLVFSYPSPQEQESPSSSTHKPLAFSLHLLPEQGSPSSPIHTPLGFTPDAPSMQSLQIGYANANPSHKLLQSSSGRSAYVDPDSEPLGFSPEIHQEPGAISNQFEAQAFADLQDLGAICDHVVQRTVVGSHSTGAGSNGQSLVPPLGAQVQQEHPNKDGVRAELNSMRNTCNSDTFPRWLCEHPDPHVGLFLRSVRGTLRSSTRGSQWPRECSILSNLR